MVTLRKRTTWVVALALFLAGSASIGEAALYTIDASELYPAIPLENPTWVLGTNYWVSVIADQGGLKGQADQIEALVGLPPNSLDELYKANVESSVVEEGSANVVASYTTEFDLTSTDPTKAVITWDGPYYFNETPKYLHVKDGDHDPSDYLFDISDWNGTDTIELINFWAAATGAISHVSIFASDIDMTEPAGGLVVPEPTSFLVWSVLGLLGVVAYRRALS